MSDRFFEYFIRWRHTLGYGVHSPLAYGIVRECIRPDTRYAYYADEAIDTTFRHDRIAIRQARLLLRLANHMKESAIATSGCNRKIASIVMKACRELRITEFAPGRRRGADVLVTFGDINLTFGCDTPTLTLKGRDYAIYVWREGMLPVTYNVL